MKRGSRRIAIALAIMAVAGTSACHKGGGIAALSPKERAKLKTAEAAQRRDRQMQSIPLQYRRQAGNVVMTSLVRQKLGAKAPASHPDLTQIMRNGTVAGATGNQQAYASNDFSDVQHRHLSPQALAVQAKLRSMTFKGHLVTMGPDGGPVVH